MGIETHRTIAITFANSSILLGSRILLAPLFMVSVDLGMVGSKGFASCVIGGFGSIIGATVGGILLGTIEIFVASFLSSRYKDAIVFLILSSSYWYVPRASWARRRVRAYDGSKKKGAETNCIHHCFRPVDQRPYSSEVNIPSSSCVWR